jgi:REP element-mobilizing transposase RayT
MARKPRIEYPGALFHVIARGNNKKCIYIDDQDFRIFLRRLNIYRERYGFRLYAYALMTNHFHLLLQTEQIPLSKIMQGLQQSYTIRIRVKPLNSFNMYMKAFPQATGATTMT